MNILLCLLKSLNGFGVSKFVKDFRCTLDLMNMGYPSTKMTMEAGSMKSCLLQSWSSCLIQPRLMLLPRIEFDLSLSSTHVLNAILKHIPLSELRPGMPQLSKFHLLLPVRTCHCHNVHWRS
ncbi:Uncharacterized protein Rs2_03557 [Raphanus sativus]|nr:Uncharacterized protein Rs2_03557 [Raphanus sativus]